MKLDIRFPNTLWIVAAFVPVIITMFLLANAGFQNMWGHPADSGSFLFSIISAPLSLPHSFASLLFGHFNPGGTFLHVTLPFWGVLGLILTGLFLTRSIYFYIVTSTILLMSSWYWYVVGAGMMGI